ncbi:ribokinase [Streptomyces sp. NBC_00654]|uniref:ribokinase n=1 Tax=Streptomyces sp. NBC_00654 TaxID=2975799 RepID=UPI002250BA03|nr:ribokinase [Streptomyces sp. NBC_00654]MCX4964754.1 ribokinase [Streptomyces sp. NBC_00654]
MHEQRPTVVVLGSLNIDLVTHVARHPGAGETVLGRGLTVLPGGKGANQAVAAARAGARVRMVGRVGDDDGGRRYLAALDADGIDTAGVVPAPGEPTGQAHIAVDDLGENTIIVIPGANGAVTGADVDRAAGALEGAQVLLLQLETPMPAVVRAARLADRAGVRVVLNASPTAEVPPELLRLADPAVVNEHEYEALGEGARSVCVTLGARGARWGEHEAVPPAVDAVDTTGAGDCFAGTLAARLAAGDSPADALGAAVAAGARATTWSGAQGRSFDEAAEAH